MPSGWVLDWTTRRRGHASYMGSLWASVVMWPRLALAAWGPGRAVQAEVRRASSGASEAVAGEERAAPQDKVCGQVAWEEWYWDAGKGFGFEVPLGAPGLKQSIWSSRARLHPNQNVSQAVCAERGDWWEGSSDLSAPIRSHS